MSAPRLPRYLTRVIRPEQGRPPVPAVSCCCHHVSGQADELTTRGRPVAFLEACGDTLASSGANLPVSGYENVGQPDDATEWQLR